MLWVVDGDYFTYVELLKNILLSSKKISIFDQFDYSIIITVVIAKLGIMLLDRENRLVIKSNLCWTRLVKPSNNIFPTEEIQIKSSLNLCPVVILPNW